MKSVYSLILLFLCTVSANISAVHLKPWYGNDLELYPYLYNRYQHYTVVESPNGNIDYSSDDYFMRLGAHLAYDAWYAEVFAVCAHTRKNDFGVDQISFIGRYRWMNDIVGDPLSLTTGVTVTKAFKPFREDFSSFHHGGIEAEFHLTFGQEKTCFDTWNTRWWGVFAVGIADLGSPWLRGDLAWEKNFCDRSYLQGFITTLWGLGGQNLNLHKRFHGYGPFAHRSVDVGALYRYHMGCTWLVDVGYSFRAYAKNFPKHASQFYLNLTYEFGTRWVRCLPVSVQTSALGI